MNKKTNVTYVKSNSGLSPDTTNKPTKKKTTRKKTNNRKGY